jgi:hypothetical protein
MTPRSQLIFDKSDSVRSRTEECKNHSHTLKLKNSKVIIIKAWTVALLRQNPNLTLLGSYHKAEPYPSLPLQEDSHSNLE